MCLVCDVVKADASEENNVHVLSVALIVQTMTRDQVEADKTPTNWWGRQNAASLKFDPKPLEALGRVFMPTGTS